MPFSLKRHEPNALPGVSRNAFASTPLVSLTYWDATHDVATADAAASWHNDDETRTWLYNHYKNAPAPVGYDPAIIPGWTSPTAPTFGALRLDPTALRVIRALEKRARSLVGNLPDDHARVRRSAARRREMERT